MRLSIWNYAEKDIYANKPNREIHYLYGGNGLAAIYVKTAGKDTLFAAVTDRQNSLTALMDVATSKIEKFSYKPWGMRRNPANWSENVVTDQPARFARGYCMHEHLPQLGLINMGGRIFNERTNQFLCADPYRQAPESWLNCNRFGYCMNNPVMYTDPDGEILIPILIAAAISAGVNVGIKAYNGQLHSAGDVAKALGWGALAGGVGGFIGVTAAPILAGGGFFAGFVTGTVCAFESTLIQSLGNHISFGDPMISNAALAFNSIMGGLTFGVGNGIMAKISGRNFWSGRPQQYCGPDMDMLPQRVATEPENIGSGRSLTAPENQEITYGVRCEEASNAVSVEGSRQLIPRPDLQVTGYANRIATQTDLYHGFPACVEKLVLENGSVIPDSRGVMVTAEGYINNKLGVYTIGLDHKGVVFHKCFYEMEDYIRQFYTR